MEADPDPILAYCIAFSNRTERAHCATMSSPGDDMPDEGAAFLKLQDGEIADGVVVADLEGEGEGRR